MRCGWARLACMATRQRQSRTLPRSARRDLRHTLSTNTVTERQGTLGAEQHTPAVAENSSVETVVLPIRGMTCAACQAHVERSLREAPGVLDATVNLLAHSAR